MIVDTPGQIEVFTWSASGVIITQALASALPTILVYVVDLVRCQNPNTFMSNMLFCCSIFYKMQIPMILVFNKEDQGDKQKVCKWMEDYDNILESLKTDKSYLSSLSKSMAMTLDEFYQGLNYVCVSSVTGSGFEKLIPAIEKAKKEYFEVTY